MQRVRPMPPDVVLRPEQASDKTAVDALYAVAFGPGRFARTAWRLRQDLAHDPAVSFVADRRNLVIGAIRQTPVTVGGVPAYLLGPLAVAETAAKQGIGRALLDRSIASARASEAHAIVLVGDLAFYGPSGFERTGEAIEFPGPVERHRLLALPLRRRVRGALRPEGPHRPAHAPQAPADPAVRKGDPIQGG
jgi:predicted N-acetyltransferase YhbS